MSKLGPKTREFAVDQPRFEARMVSVSDVDKIVKIVYKPGLPTLDDLSWAQRVELNDEELEAAITRGK